MSSFLERVTLLDVIDILLVAGIVYNLLKLIRGTRSVQILSGLFLLIAVWWAAQKTQLTTLETLLRNFAIFLPFALIVLQRLEGLRNYIENGIALDANVSFDLLANIFSPDTPLHDGAAIIQQDRIAAAACFLPLSFDPELSTELGTRHRAALGVTTETDALAVVVSEETGTISVAVDGELIRGLDAKNLRNTLYQYLIADLSGSDREAA